MLTSTVIVPTYNRPVDLQKCLQSILSQSRLPSEVIIVDDGALPEPPLKGEFEARGIRYVYTRKDQPDVCASRNLGARLATGEIVLLLEDDVVMEPDYVAELMGTFERDTTGRVGGVGGVTIGTTPRGVKAWVRALYRACFMISGFREGRILPSGFCTELGESVIPLRKEAPVDFHCGGICAYRAWVFKEFTFARNYVKQGYGEDKDFSHRVARKYPLLANPRARVTHNYSPSMRDDYSERSRKFIMGLYYFFKAHARKGWWSWFFFGYAVFGYALAGWISLACRPSRKKLAQARGVMQGVGQILKGAPSLAATGA